MKLNSRTEAPRIKGIFENTLNDIARANNVFAAINVQTFADKKQIGIGFATMSKPVIIIQIAARDGQLLIERAICSDETLVDYDYRKASNEPTR